MKRIPFPIPPLEREMLIQAGLAACEKFQGNTRRESADYTKAHDVVEEVIAIITLKYGVEA